MKILRALLGLVAIFIVIWTLCFYSPGEKNPRGGVTVVRFAIWGGVAEREAWEALAEDFHRKHPDIIIETQMIPVKYDEKIMAMLAAKTAPDIINLPFGEFASKGMLDDVLLPIDEFMARDKDLNLDDLFPGILAMGRWKGKQYSIPHALGPQVLFYNVRHFKEAGLDTPNEYYERGEWNWETFLKCCKKLVRRDRNGNVIRWAFVRYTPIWTYISLNGGKPFNEDYTECYFDDPRVYEAVQRVADLTLVHKVSPPPAIEKQIGKWQAFARGDVSMFISGPWQVSRLKNMKDKYDIAPPPMAPGGRTITLAGRIGGIWRGTKVPEAAYKWISYLATPDARKIWSKLGFDIPALKSLAAHPEEWIDPEIIPDHFHIFFDLAPSILKPPPATNPVIPKKAERLIQSAIDLVWMGKKRAKEALIEIMPEVNRILKTGR